MRIILFIASLLEICLFVGLFLSIVCLVTELPVLGLLYLLVGI